MARRWAPKRPGPWSGLVGSGHDEPRLDAINFWRLFRSSFVKHPTSHTPASCRSNQSSIMVAMRLSGIQKEVLSLYRSCLRECRKKPEASRKHFQVFAR